MQNTEVKKRYDEEWQAILSVSWCIFPYCTAIRAQGQRLLGLLWTASSPASQGSTAVKGGERTVVMGPRDQPNEEVGFRGSGSGGGEDLPVTVPKVPIRLCSSGAYPSRRVRPCSRRPTHQRGAGQCRVDCVGHGVGDQKAAVHIKKKTPALSRSSLGLNVLEPDPE